MKEEEVVQTVNDSPSPEAMGLFRMHYEIHVHIYLSL